MERRFGSQYTAGLFLALQLMAASLHVLLACQFRWEYDSCAIGLSALLMALKVIMQQDPAAAQERSHFFGFTLSGYWICWLEIGLIYLLFPHSSLVGHCSGLMAGLIFDYAVNPYRKHFGDSRAGQLLKRLHASLHAFAPNRWTPLMMQGGVSAGADVPAGEGQRRDLAPSQFLERSPPPLAVANAAGLVARRSLPNRQTCLCLFFSAQPHSLRSY